MILLKNTEMRLLEFQSILIIVCQPSNAVTNTQDDQLTREKVYSLSFRGFHL
jgi:hypothetical protein